jgi:hypothetical protein
LSSDQLRVEIRAVEQVEYLHERQDVCSTGPEPPLKPQIDSMDRIVDHTIAGDDRAIRPQTTAPIFGEANVAHITAERGLLP